jgi:signal transduction histidine kinase
MSAWAANILLMLSSALGVNSMPQELPSGWTITQPWEPRGNYLELKASSTTLPLECQKSPTSQVVFPLVIHSAHNYYLDGKQIGGHGDPAFNKVDSFYAKPTLNCSSLLHGSEFTWKVTAYSHYFARLNSMPTIAESAAGYNLFAYSFHAMAGGMLLILGVFTTIVSWGKVSRTMLVSFAGATLALPFYFICSAPGFFGLPGSMLLHHRLADLGLWLGAVGIFWFLQAQGLFGKRLLHWFLASALAAITILIIAPSGDMAQFGTTIPFFVAPFLLTTSLLNLWRAHRHGQQVSYTIIRLTEILFFVLGSLNDILFILGVTAGPPLLPVGMLGILFFAAVSLEQQVRQTYKERDYLRANLEHEVAAKTESLSKALQDLGAAQAEIIASAKLASLGTLSAGIAHEINNSLNYVNGSLSPLGSILRKESLTDSDRAKAGRLLDVMRDGLHLTAQIISNLKGYARTAGEIETILLRELAESALAILRPKLKKDIVISLEIPQELAAPLDKVSLTQVLINLIDNGCDAMENNTGEKKLTISAAVAATGWMISIRDTGPGIPDHVRTQMFDPFFTTKPVGKGTGLGLHIVNSEIKKHGGKIEVDSSPGVGTTMTIKFPMPESNGQNEQKEAS